MSPIRLALAAALSLTLTACGVPDLVAHGVKSYEHSRDADHAAASNVPPAQQPATPAAYQPAPAAEADTAPSPVPQRDVITSEPLR